MYMPYPEVLTKFPPIMLLAMDPRADEGFEEDAT
jgi:hypothetical protein